MASPPIIDQALFDQVQQTLRSRHPAMVAPRFVNGPTLLGGVAFCADCGTPVYSCAAGDDPPAYSLRIGCLDERVDLPPQRQIWCDSAMPWSRDLRTLPGLPRQ